MDFKNLSRTFLSDRKKLVLLGALLAIVMAFIFFLISLSASNDPVTPPQNTVQTEGQSGALTLDGTEKVPAAQKYDYTTLLKDDAPAAPPADPFAGMKESSAPAADPTAPLSSAEEAPQSQVTESVPVEPPSPDTTSRGSEPLPSGTTMGAFLYCDSFATQSEAEGQKALIAFQGQSSEVVQNSEGRYQLKLGPYVSRDAARTEFNQLGEQGLVSRCALVDEPTAH